MYIIKSLQLHPFFPYLIFFYLYKCVNIANLANDIAESAGSSRIPFPTNSFIEFVLHPYTVPIFITD
jgi:hypothetical protein